MSQPPVPGHHREEFRSPTSAPRTTAPVLHSFTRCATLAPDPHPRLRRLLHIPYGMMNTGIHDRDRVYGGNFATRLAGLGIESIHTPVQARSANAIAERLVRSLRQECLDHILPLCERHVRAVLAEFVTYYNQDRPHRSLTLETPAPSPRQPAGKVVSRPVLNGLHHFYERAA
jgi:hypothetical protein